MENCPVCNTKPNNPRSIGDRVELDCPRCGHYQMSRSAVSITNTKLKNQQKQALVSHYIRKRVTDNDKIPTIKSNWLNKIIEEHELPDPHTQGENLILWVGKTYANKFEEWVRTKASENPALRAVIGAKNDAEVEYIYRNLKAEGLFDLQDSSRADLFRLNFKGWERYHELLKNPPNTKLVFMAMPFGKNQLNKVYEKYKKAVKDTGFKLTRADETPEAGNITNKILVDIQRSKFVIAELTYNNNGAYWEAGFAEGLGKKVIYMFNKTLNGGGETHFDIRQSQTIFWEEGKEEDCAEKLKNCIRATFPDEAILDDPETKNESEDCNKSS